MVHISTEESQSMSANTEDEPAEDCMMDIHPTSSAGGVFSSRISQRKTIHGTKSTPTKEIDLEVASVSEAPEVDERDLHSKQVNGYRVDFSMIPEYTKFLKIGIQRVDTGMVRNF